MTKLIRSFLVSVLMISILSACFPTAGDTAAQIALATPTLAATTIQLTVQTDAATLTTAGQVIKYTYTVRNSGAASVPGTIVVTGAACPAVNTIGNLDGAFDPNETITCTFDYIVTQADLDKGSVTNISTAIVNGINSNSVTTTTSKAPPTVLNLTKTANPATYDQLGQIITYTYVIMNSGAATLGPPSSS